MSCSAYIFAHPPASEEGSSPMVCRDLTFDQLDPFYEKLFEDGKYFYSIGDYAAAIENFKIAFFGFIDSPPKLLESFVYLTVCYYLTENLEKAKHFNNEIKRLKLQEYFKVIKLPEDLLDKFHDMNAYFERLEQKTATAAPGNPPATQPMKSSASAARTASESVLPPSIQPLPARSPQAELETEIKKLKESIKKDRTDFEAHLRLSAIYLEKKKLKAAKSVLEDLLKLAPDNAPAHFELGKILASEKKYRDALQHFQKASSSLQSNIQLCYELGKVYFILKNYKEAREEFLKVKEIIPTYKDTEKYLVQIEEKEKARRVPPL